MEPGGDERSPALIGTLGGRAAAVRAAVVPDWLAEVVRPKRVPAALGGHAAGRIAIWVPLAVGSRPGPVARPAARDGRLMSIMIDQAAVPAPVQAGGGRGVRRRGGPGHRVGDPRPGLGGGGGPGRGRGGVRVLARLGRSARSTGLQLLVYCALRPARSARCGPCGIPRLEFVAGVAWALVLLVPAGCPARP